MQNLWCYEAFLNYATIAKYVCLCWPPKNWNLNHDEVVFGLLYGPGQSWAVGRLGRSWADWVTGWQAAWATGQLDGKRLWVDSTDRECVYTHLRSHMCLYWKVGKLEMFQINWILRYVWFITKKSATKCKFTWLTIYSQSSIVG